MKKSCLRVLSLMLAAVLLFSLSCPVLAVDGESASDPPKATTPTVEEEPPTEPPDPAAPTEAATEPNAHAAKISLIENIWPFAATAVSAFRGKNSTTPKYALLQGVNNSSSIHAKRPLFTSNSGRFICKLFFC